MEFMCHINIIPKITTFKHFSKNIIDGRPSLPTDPVYPHSLYLLVGTVAGRTCALLLCIVMAATRHYYSYHHYIFTSKGLAQHLLSGYVVLHSLFNLVSLFYVVYLVQGHYLFTKSGRRECI